MPDNQDQPPPPRKPRANGRSWPAAADSAQRPAAAVPASPSSDADSEERWTIGRLLTWTADYLKRKGSEFARLDAEVLLAEVLGWQRVQLYTHFDDAIGDAPRASFRELVKKRADGCPVAYLVGRKEFYSLPLVVNPSVLIPRPESEFVVVEFLSVARHWPAPRCVDVGTGSGCLAIACLHEHKKARFFATDVSQAALEVAERNAQRHGMGERATFRLGSLLEPVAGEGPFDAIVSNPPYIATDVIPTLERGVRDFEPRLALDGGADGMAVVTDLVHQAVPALKVGGVLILEIGSDQEPRVRALLAGRPEWDVAPTIRDHANHPRVIRATRTM